MGRYPSVVDKTAGIEPFEIGKNAPNSDLPDYGEVKKSLYRVGFRDLHHPSAVEFTEPDAGAEKIDLQDCPVDGNPGTAAFVTHVPGKQTLNIHAVSAKLQFFSDHGPLCLRRHAD